MEDVSESRGSMGELRSVLQTLSTKFQAGSDVSQIQAINVACEKLQVRRAQQLAISRDTLHQWMRKVEGAKWEAQRPADRSEAAHAERMALLDKERYALGKSINELELAIQREEAVSAQTRTRSESINSRINAIGAEASELSRDRVRSLVFRGEIGLSWAIEELDSDKNFKNQPNKCRVISKLHNDIHTITFPPNLCDGPQSNSVNAYESTKRLWDAISPPSLKTNRD